MLKNKMNKTMRRVKCLMTQMHLQRQHKLNTNYPHIKIDWVIISYHLLLLLIFQPKQNHPPPSNSDSDSESDVIRQTIPAAAFQQLRKKDKKIQKIEIKTNKNGKYPNYSEEKSEERQTQPPLKPLQIPQYNSQMYPMHTKQMPYYPMIYPQVNMPNQMMQYPYSYPTNYPFIPMNSQHSPYPPPPPQFSHHNQVNPMPYYPNNMWNSQQSQNIFAIHPSVTSQYQQKEKNKEMLSKEVIPPKQNPRKKKMISVKIQVQKHVLNIKQKEELLYCLKKLIKDSEDKGALKLLGQFLDREQEKQSINLILSEMQLTQIGKKVKEKKLEDKLLGEDHSQNIKKLLNSLVKDPRRSRT